MALEFKLNEIVDHDGTKGELFIDAQDSIGDRSIWLTLLDNDGEQHDFEGIEQEDLYAFALYLNHKLGFELCNLSNIEKVILEDKKSSV